MIWQKPHISKIYEALTAIADGDRIELVGDNKARCYSSSRGKFYEIEFDLENNSMMSNDNTAYYTDSISYPMVAVLMLKDKLKYDTKLLELLKGIVWKDIMQKFKNDYDKGIEFVLNDLKNKSIDTTYIKSEIDSIYTEVCKLEIKQLGSKKIPPKAY